MSLLQTLQQDSKKESFLSKLLHFFLLAGTITLPFVVFPILQNGISTPKLFVLYTIVLVGVFIWILQSVLAKSFRLRKTPLDIPFLLFGGIFLIGSLFSVIPAVSFLGKMDVFVLHTTAILSLLVWAWLLVQSTNTMKRWHGIVQAILLSGALQGVVFLAHSYSPLPFLNTLGVSSFFTASNILLSLYIGTITVLALGQLLSKHTNVVVKILPFITAFIGLFALLRLGFSSGFIILAVGMAFLIMIGTTYLTESHNTTVIACFTLFIASVLILLFGIPNFVKATLPVEVSMGAASSWDISKASLLDSAKNFLVGSGPGTFLQSFSEFRDTAFNVNQFAWTVRFNTPYNSFFAVLSETGVLGIITFFVIIIGSLGLIFGAWSKTRPLGRTEQNTVSTAAEAVRVQIFVVAAAWVALTVGMFFTFFEVGLWVLWWTLLALVLTGISSLIPRTITERRISLEVSPQYSLLLSFGMVTVATGIIVIAAFGSRMFLADVAYTKALRSTTIEETAEHLSTTLTYRSSYVPYQLSLARLSLQRARQEAQMEEPNADRIANYLAMAVNTAREASTKHPTDVETWETLASMYLNTQSLVPDANQWAQQALESAIELEPTNPIFQWQMGNAKAFAGDLEGAEESYKQAIRLKPDYLVAYVSLSALLESQERYDQAIAVYQPILNRLEHNPEALFTLGRLFFNRAQEEDINNAETVLLRAVELSPNYANARYILGLLYESQGKTQAALEQYEKISELNPDNQEITNKINTLRGASTPPAQSSEESSIE